jgi:hypothetical protein
MPREEHGYDPWPYLVDDRFRFSLYGRWHKGGWLEISYDGAVVEMLKLPKAKWGAMATLARRAKAMVGLGRPSAFITPEELALELRKRTPLKFAGRQNVTRYICDLRKLLTGAKAAQHDTNGRQGPHKWGHRVVESQQSLGYRISVRPENIDVHDLDEIRPPRDPANGSDD